MKKILSRAGFVIIGLIIVLIFVLTGCGNNDVLDNGEMPNEITQAEHIDESDSTESNETSEPDETESIENEVYVANRINEKFSITVPFTPIFGNVIMLSQGYLYSLIFTDTSIWKITNVWEPTESSSYTEWQLSEPVRMMDTVENIDRVIENTHILTTNQSLYFLDFENGQAVRQLENVTSTYHHHIGTLSNPLRYAQTADGSAWQVDTIVPIKLPDGTELMCGKPREDSVPSAILNRWFENVRRVMWDFVLTEDNVLWHIYNSWGDDAVPEKIMENVKSINAGGIITTDNELWSVPWTRNTSYFIMDNVASVDNWLIITTNNELWVYISHFDEPFNEPFKIFENVKSLQGLHGFITLDNSLWRLPSYWGTFSGLQNEEPTFIKENVLRSWWNWSGTEYILTTDGSLWLINHEDNYFAQIFQGTN